MLQHSLLYLMNSQASLDLASHETRDIATTIIFHQGQAAIHLIRVPNPVKHMGDIDALHETGLQWC